MKGDFAKAYTAGRQAYREKPLGVWDHIFIFLVVAFTVASLEEHWLTWYLTLLLCIPVVLTYGVIKGIVSRRKAQQSKE